MEYVKSVRARLKMQVLGESGGNLTKSEMEDIFEWIWEDYEAVVHAEMAASEAEVSTLGVVQ